MKCFPVLTLLIACSIIPIASAQTPEQAAKKNAAMARWAQKAANPPRQARTSPGAQHVRRSGTANARQTRQFRQQTRVNSGVSRRTNSFNATRRSLGSSSGSAAVRSRVYTPRAVGTTNVARELSRRNGQGGNRIGRGGNRNGGNNLAVNRGNRGNQNWNGHRGGRHGHWSRHHRNRAWWLSNYSRFALFGGGYYYWNSGYWYPAYGYDPYYSTYVYDAPLYGYNNLDPGQVVASVQTELQRHGYNPGSVDGDYGPATRAALLAYQNDNGLPVTGEIDEATLNSLGLQ